MEADTDHYFPKAKELFDGEVSTDRAGYVKSTLKALEMIREDPYHDKVLHVQNKQRL